MNTFVALVFFALAQPQSLDPARLELLLTGNTIRIQVGQSSTATLYFAPDGAVRAVMPDGKAGSGKWSLQPDGGYCISWEKGPQRSCTTVLWSPGEIRLIDAEGKPRGTITQVTVGEAH
jgi:hypothetical protein